MLSARWLFAACTVIVLGAIVPSPVQPDVSIVRIGDSAVVRAHHLTGPVTIAIVPRAPHISRVYEYYDPAYARGRAMSDRFAAGFATHFAIALEYRHYDARVERVNAHGLAHVLNGNASGACVFVPGGILPDRVRSNGHDALRSWLSRGGLVIWAGAPFDAYYSPRGTADVPGEVRGPDTSVWPRLYGASGPLRTAPDIHSPPLRFGSVEAPARAATGVTFNLTTFGVDASRLSQAGGLAIGYVDDRNESSVSVLPVGSGRVVIFGDAVDNELAASQDIAQIFLTGAWYEPHALKVGARIGPGDAQINLAAPKKMQLLAFGDAPYYFPFNH